eukprot:1080511-Prymnesium_polylepis.1
MGRSLFASSATFRLAIGECSSALASFPEWAGPPLVDVLFGDSAAAALPASTAFTQPALVALSL